MLHETLTIHLMKYLELENRLNAMYGDFNYFVINDKCEIVEGVYRANLLLLIA